MPPSYYGVFKDNDSSGRMMALVNYNNDVADDWEWSGQGRFPVDTTNDAYKLGVNYMILTGADSTKKKPRGFAPAGTPTASLAPFDSGSGRPELRRGAGAPDAPLRSAGSLACRSLVS